MKHRVYPSIFVAGLYTAQLLVVGTNVVLKQVFTILFTNALIEKGKGANPTTVNLNELSFSLTFSIVLSKLNFPIAFKMVDVLLKLTQSIYWAPASKVFVSDEPTPLHIPV